MTAWRVVVAGIPSIVFAKNRSQAKHKTILSAQEAGYDYSYKDVESAIRAKGFDCLAHPANVGRCHNEKHLEMELERAKGGE